MSENTIRLFELHSGPNFCESVKKLKKNNPDLSYTECVLEVCEQWEIEPERAAEFIDTPLKKKIESEAQKKHLLPSKTKGTLF
jgi:hypothetical protein